MFRFLRYVWFLLSWRWLFRKARHQRESEEERTPTIIAVKDGNWSDPTVWRQIRPEKEGDK